MKYLTSLEAAGKLGISKRMMNIRCQRGMVEGAVKDGNRWRIPTSYIDEKVGNGKSETFKTGNQRCFNTQGACIEGRHFLVPMTDRLVGVRKLVDSGKYFSINKARQFGKTTTILALQDFLKADYTVIAMDFQMQMSSATFATEENFVVAFAKAFSLLAAGQGKNLMLEFSDKESMTMPNLFLALSSFCAGVSKPVVLIIDEVDSATNNQVFMDFLSQLRGYYLRRDVFPIFQSVILVGVYDVKNIQRRIRPEDEHRENSPWNIAADFDVEMAFTAEEIALMLKTYCRERQVEMNCKAIAKEIHAYTEGYPYLVSRICERIDESKGKWAWDANEIKNVVGNIIKEQNTLFEDIAKKLKDFPEVREIIYNILFIGKTYPYNINAEPISIGTMFGFLKEEDGHVAVANRLFEIWFYNLFIAEDAVHSKTYDSGARQKNDFVKENKLDMRLVLEKFCLHFTEVYADYDEEFIEENGRRLFLLYIRPIINGVGNYYIESRTRSMGRTDLVLDYLGTRYIVEMKIWHGDEYNKKGEKQLQKYLSDYNMKRGYLLSFNFNKNKKVGVTEHHFKDMTILEAVV